MSNTVVGLLVNTSLVTTVFKLVVLESANIIVALVTYSVVAPFVIVSVVSVTVASDAVGSVAGVSYTGASVVVVLVRCIFDVVRML